MKLAIHNAKYSFDAESTYSSSFHQLIKVINVKFPVQFIRIVLIFRVLLLPTQPKDHMSMK
jgi:hypothetical protein